VANRRGFDIALSREWRQARRSDEPLAVLMIDVDHFKLFNDRYGHPAGDACLHAVAGALSLTSQRPADAVARYGGEEFVMLLPQTSRAGAALVARNVISAVDGLAIVHDESPTASHLTVSIGVGCYDDQSACWMRGTLAPGRLRHAIERPTSLELMRAADHALYAAKHAGRAQGKLLDISDVESPRCARALPSESSEIAIRCMPAARDE
jgi:diguanylate cyclase (GGDEF)-like protein